MNWRRITARESRIQDARGGTIARVWLGAGGWSGSALGQQSEAYEDESAARQWCESKICATEGATGAV